VSLLKLVLLGIVISNKELQLDYKLNIYNVERILDSRVSRRKIEYLVK
jgi:hypothetical protein